MNNNFKRFLSVILILTMLVLIISGCKKKNSDPTISDSEANSVIDQINDNQQTESEQIMAEITAGSVGLAVFGKDKPDVVTMFSNAMKVYTDILYGTIVYDNSAPIQQIASAGGNYLIYHLVMDDRFYTYNELITYLNSYFTKEVISEFCDLSDFAENEEGRLCAKLGMGGSNQLYAGHTFNVVEDSDTVIKFYATVYNYKSFEDIPNEKIPFYTTPEKPENYDIKKVNFTLTKQDNGKWLFSEFGAIF